jgi:acyl-CoA synthetase (AMP-forming)/AMP-acid ligase II
VPTVDPADTTFVSLLRARATAQPDRVGYVHLVDGEAEEVPLSYAEADRNARAIAVLLGRSLAPGDRALLLYPPGLDFLSALLGCIYAGVIAVPAYPPDPTRLERTLPRLRAIADDADIAAVLTLSSIESLLGQSFAHTSDALPGRWICTDGVAPELAEEWREPDIAPDSTAVLQYTSGSTSLPKGVMFGHRNLIAHFAQIQRTVRLTEESVGVSWLPPYHDMGLIGSLLLPIFVGFRVAFFSPIAFLQKPMRWLHAISRHRANFSGGPNFAYDLAARKVSAEDIASLDLSCWNYAPSSAEPVHAATVERFSETFAPCGFRREAFAPCYGLAEATLMVTAKRWGVPPTVRSVDRERLEAGSVVPGDESGRVLVGCGLPETGTQIRIVDPESRRARGEDEVGEIWVAGVGVAQGYWGRPQESERCFRAFIAESEEGPFLRTGDLGFQRDGEVFVTGRIKDLMIVRGRNLHPEDVEAEIAGCHPALRPGGGAAFSVLEDEQEQLVVVHEVTRGSTSCTTTTSRSSWWWCTRWIPGSPRTSIRWCRRSAGRSP